MIVLIKSRRQLHNYMNADADRKAFSMDSSVVSSGFPAVLNNEWLWYPIYTEVRHGIKALRNMPVWRILP